MAYAGGGALLLVLGLLLGISLMSGGSDDATTTSVAALDSTTSSTASATTTEATTIVATTEPTTTTTGVAETTTATTTTTEVTAGPPAGFDLFDGSRNGFTVALPDNWLAMDLTASDFQDVVDEMEGYLTPEEIEVIRQVIADGAELGLLGFGVTGDPNVNVLVMPLGPLDTLDLLEAMLPDQIATQPGIELESVERVDLNGVEGLLFVTRNASDAEGIQHQYYVLGDDLGYVATFTALTAGADVSVFAEIMRTFTLVG